MKPVNPIYIALVLILLFSYILTQLKDNKTLLDEQKNRLANQEIIVNKINLLKKTWDDPKKVQKDIQKITGSLILKNTKLDRTQTNKLISLSYKSLNNNQLNYLTNKIFNEVFKLKSFKIEKIDDYQASLFVEIEL